MTFEGDVLISQFDEENYDIIFNNGQPEMTKDLRNIAYLYVFGEESWYNLITNTDEEKMESKFPEIIKRAVVSDDTLAKGITAIKNSLQPLITLSIASIVNVFGVIINAYSMGWKIEIEQPQNNITKFYIIWEKGIIKNGIA